MLTRLHVVNYRSIGEVAVDLGPLTVLVGQNGSGKSNLIDAIHFVSDALGYGLDAAVTRRHGVAELRRWSPSKPRNVLIEMEITSEPSRLRAHYSLAIRSQPGGQYNVKSEALHCEVPGEMPCDFEIRDGTVTRTSGGRAVGDRVPDRGLQAPVWPVSPAIMFVRHVREMCFCSIFPNALREPQNAEHEYPLDPQGRNLASVLRAIEKRDGGAMEHIKAAMAKLVPQLRDVKVSPVGGYLVVKFQHEEESGKRHWLDASQESDGTLRMLGVLTALYQYTSPPLIAIEEPELTIHPGMLATLRDVIEEASQRRSQVIVTTHSPDLMSLFDVDALRVVEMTPEGTRVGPVAQHQREAVRDRLFLPGELARIEGLSRERSEAVGGER